MARFVVDLRFASLTSLSIAVLLGALAGCGDDTPGIPHLSGSGGSGGGTGGADNDAGGAGGGGAAGSDAGVDTSTDTVVDTGTDTGMDTMGEVPKPCYMVTFTAPTDGAMLTVANDKDGDNCGNGFQMDVQITTDAPDGADVSLFGGNALLKAGTVLNGAVTFADVQIATTGATQLSIQFPGREMCTAATTKAQVSVDCHVPACSVTKPTISGTHPKLNAVPAPAGDRVSADGSPYQAAFEVTTDVEDGQSVSLLVDDAASPATVTTVTAMATGGKATFSGVTLTPDATYEVQATCPDRNGVVGRSTKGTYIVDTTAPSLTVSQPHDGQFFGPSELVNGSFPVFASTTSADAAGLSPGLGAAAQNLCAFIGSSPLCVAVAATGASTRIDIPCTGDAPFDIKVVLNDDAGNTTSTTINAVTCFSTDPSVQIITPLSGAPSFNDPSKRLLAASGGVTDVVACTNRAGTAVLSVGHMGDTTLNQVGGAITTTAGGAGCPPLFGFQVTFPGVALFDSLENPDGTLLAATELRVDLTDGSASTGTSPLVDVWVDAHAPMIGLTSPTGLCGSFHQTPGLSSFDTPVTLSSDTATVILTVANGGSTPSLSPTTFAGNVATFANVSFDQGQSTLAATATDPAGNSTTMTTTPAPCTVTVGMQPIVSFTSPLPPPANVLCASGSAGANCINDTGAAVGWQGPLLVNVTGGSNPLPGRLITFSVGTTILGTATTDALGNATINATLLDGTVTVTATTDDVPGRGVGTGTVTVLVDTGPPGQPANLVATVPDKYRRQTSMQMSWDAPGDNGGTVTGYQVRVAKAQINSVNFDDPSVTTSVSYTGLPGAPGAPDGVLVKDLAIETGYFFAVRAVDAAGNLGNIAATSAATTATFRVTTLSGQATTDHIGYQVDGTGDFGGPAGAFAGDGLSDLVVGNISSNKAYIYFASTNGYPALPSVTITGSFTFFGLAVVNAGDLDGDGLADIAVSSPSDGNGKVYIFSRKSPSWSANGTWPPTLSDTQANYVISADATYLGKFFGQRLASARGFEAGNDLVIGTPGLSTNTGQLLIVRGGSSFGSLTLPDAVNTIIINGTTTGNLLGAAVVDIGPFDGSGRTTLLASGTGMGSTFAFTAAGLPASTNGVGTAVDSTVFTPASSKYGSPLSPLGPLGGSPAAVAIGAIGSFVDVHLGTSSSGPLQGAAGAAPAPTVRFVDPAAGNSFGVLTLASGVPGTAQTLSWIGSDSTGDLVMAGQSETGNPIYLVNGGDLALMSGTVDVTTSPKVMRLTYLPSDWKGYAGSSVVVDSNGDGFPDIALGEIASAKAGRVIVLY